MNDLTLPLNALSFAQLTTLGRSMIPTLDPDWTDQNIHDPGIMLMELMAWIAEAQMYSMDRLRRDERMAYAALLGVKMRGPLPAQAFLWPADDAQFTEGLLFEKGVAFSPDRPTLPAFYASAAVQLTQASLIRVETIYADGTSHDWTLVNAEQSATFLPFGDSSQPDARLLLTFQGQPPAQQTYVAPLSLGWQIETAAVSSPSTKPQPLNLDMVLSDSDGDRRIEAITDTTGGLLHSGVLLFSPGAIAPDKGKFRLTLRSTTGGFARAPRVNRIGLNVIPVEQTQQIQNEPGGVGPDLPVPNQQILLAQTGFMFTVSGAKDIRVTTVEQGQSFSWSLVADLENSGPGDRHFAFDSSIGGVTFGNGINGMYVPPGAVIRISYSVCAGSSGNVPAQINWRGPGAASLFLNPEPASGGADATSLDDLRDLARVDVDQNRPLVTAGDVVQAAMSFADLGVMRAMELPWDATQPPGSRSLVVAGPHDETATGTDLKDAQELLAAVRSRITPRLPLGQSMRVQAPNYVPVKITATVTAARNTDPAVVQKNVLTALRQRVVLASPDGVGEWPWGKPVTQRSVEGWLRKAPGVAQVVRVTFSTGLFTATSLPDLQVAVSDITVNRAAAGGAP